MNQTMWLSNKDKHLILIRETMPVAEFVHLIHNILWLAASVLPRKGHKLGNGGSSNLDHLTMKMTSEFKLAYTMSFGQKCFQGSARTREANLCRGIHKFTLFLYHPGCVMQCDFIRNWYLLKYGTEIGGLLPPQFRKCFWWDTVFPSSHSLYSRLLAATIGPLANVTSIAALVTYWRQDLLDLAGEVLSPLQGIPIRDPRWCVFHGPNLILQSFQLANVK